MAGLADPDLDTLFAMARAAYAAQDGEPYPLDRNAARIGRPA